jgi:hypothetical protein
MNRNLNRLLRTVKDLQIEAAFRRDFWQSRVTGNSSKVVVCMTSYPERIQAAWLALESLFRQDEKDIRIVLVLTKSQFPGGKLPRMLNKQITKGLEIIWVQEDGKSFDHLWPAYRKYPSSSIISVDDDKFYPENLVSGLVAASRSMPGTIIGSRGWEIRPINGEVRFGDGWVRATPESIAKQLFMPPGNGSLYPPDSLPEMTGDSNLMRELCPTADDVWYWAMARINETPSHCLGWSPHRPVWRQSRTKALADLDAGGDQFLAVLHGLELEIDVTG